MGLKSKKIIEEHDIAHIHSKANEEFEQLSGKKILLTGAGGFLGYYLIKSFLLWNDKNPDKTIFLTALSTFRGGIPQWFSQYSQKEDFKIISADFLKYSFKDEENYDYIIHAASIASPKFYRQYPIVTINANVLGLYKILDYMIARKERNPIKGLLYFSSSEVYGDPTKFNIPTPEDYNGNVSFTGPRACYDESKRFCETLCVNYSITHNLPIKSARPFNNYGPGMKITDGRVIADFAKNLLDNTDIVMFSDGAPTRTFCYVADAVVGYLKILIKGKSGQAYNIGVESPEVSIRQLAERMVNIAKKDLGYTGKVIVEESKDKNYLTDNPQRRCPVITKAKEELGYNPTVSLEEGLFNTLLWYKGEI